MAKTESLVLEAPERLVMRSFEIPDLGPDDGLLEVELAGICGTDWKCFHGKTPYATPLIMGHEILGRLASVGKRMAQRTGLQEGDRVTVTGRVPCWSCADCYSGNYRYCRNRLSYGTWTSSNVPPHLWGAFGQYMYVAPGSILDKVDPSVPAEAAVLVQGVIANGYQWVRTFGRVQPRQVVLVQGCGPQGLACTLVAKECGASLIVVTGLAQDSQRLALAREFGADVTINVDEENVVERVRDLTGGAMADTVVEVSGSPTGIQASVQAVRRQGTIVLAGLTGKETLTPILMDHLVWNEITIKGAFTKGSVSVADSLALVASRRFPLEKMITHVYPLDQAEAAIRAIGGETPGLYPIKAAIRPNGAPAL
jgi:alcohol dehydrogenase